jgi:hypothetical protein
MASIEWTEIRNCLVARETARTWRWYEAIGPNVVKYALSVIGPPTDNTTGMPTEFINTLVNASTFTLADVQGGAVVLTGGGADNDGVKLQLGAEAGTTGENVSFAGDFPTYFSVKFQLADADQSDILAGFFITDTTALDGGTDGVYFRSVDADATLYFVLEQDSAETATAVGTLVDATDVHCEMFYWGHNVYVYVDGVLMTTIADTDANFCNDELLRLTLEFLDGEAVGNTATIKELRFIQIQR